MNEIRATFIEASNIASAVMSDRAIRAGWDGPSALEHWSLRGLAGHLVRGTTSVEHYLNMDEAPAEDPITPYEYYASAVGDDTDLSSELHRAIRQRGEDMAEQGFDALVEHQRATIERLRGRFETEPGNRKVRVYTDVVLLLDDYLVTRLVELTLHIDDLAVSAGLETPPLPLRATELAIGNLVDVAKHRHGDLAVLRALARRERDKIFALRVL